MTLTDEGRRTRETAPDALQDLFAARFSDLPDWEQSMVVASLERVVGLLNAEEIDASPLLHSTAIDK